MKNHEKTGADAELKAHYQKIGPPGPAQTSTRDWLEKKGHRFEPPGAVGEAKLEEELWRLIDALAEDARIFFYGTDHLTDAELYAKLWEEVLPFELPDADRDPMHATHWTFSGDVPYEDDVIDGLDFGDDLDEDEDYAEEPRLKRVCQRDEQLPKR